MAKNKSLQKRIGESFNQMLSTLIAKTPCGKPKGIEPPILSPRQREVQEVLNLRKNLKKISKSNTNSEN